MEAPLIARRCRRLQFRLLARFRVLQQQPPARQAPTFRVEVNYVEIDATVIDAQGNFVRGLTKDDFELVEEGKPQTISAFTMVDLPIARADPPLCVLALSVPPRPWEQAFVICIMALPRRH